MVDIERARATLERLREKNLKRRQFAEAQLAATRSETRTSEEIRRDRAKEKELSHPPGIRAAEKGR